MPTAPAIGIDLGTTNSCVAVVRNDKVEVIPISGTNIRSLPSYVSYTETDCVIGDGARSLLVSNPKNTIFNAKRLIGRTFEDIKEYAKTLPYHVVPGNAQEPRIEVEYMREKTIIGPEDVSGMVLRKLKMTAEQYLDIENVTDAVITVPAYLNNAQREATMMAAKIAGLNVLQLINEPTAAAIAYGLDNSTGIEEVAGNVNCVSSSGTKRSKTDTNITSSSEITPRKVVVFDMGGGTLDVSVLYMHGREITARSTAGLNHLGGEDVTHRMVQEFVNKLENEHQIPDVNKNSRLLNKIRNEFEKAKIALTDQHQYNGVIDYMEKDYIISIDLHHFEKINADLFKSVLQPIETALRDANYSKTEIDDVIFVGGSSRIPKLSKIIQEYFGGKLLRGNINADEAIAYGAAVFAAKKALRATARMSALRLVDLIPKSLSIAVDREEIMDRLIERHNKIPFKITKSYTTAFDEQTSIKISVYEGEMSLAKNNELLGELTLTNLKSLPRGCVKVDVTFQITPNGTLTVTAVDSMTNQHGSIVITNNTTMKRYPIECMLLDKNHVRNQ